MQEEIQEKVIAAYNEELESSKKPGYKPAKYEDLEDFDYEALNEDTETEKPMRKTNRFINKSARSIFMPNLARV